MPVGLGAGLVAGDEPERDFLQTERHYCACLASDPGVVRAATAVARPGKVGVVGVGEAGTGDEGVTRHGTDRAGWLVSA
jgi:hypothetical protein